MSAGQAAADPRATQAGPLSGIAERYVGALFDLAREENALEKIAGDLKSLRATIDASPELKAFISSPVYGAESQRGAILAIADRAGFNLLTRNFLGLVATNRRLFVLERMISGFAARLAAHRGEVSAEAIAAAPLNDDQTKRLRTEIEAIVGKAINLSTRVDPGLLGGLVVKVGSTMIDSSLKTKLNRIRSVMKEA